MTSSRIALYKYPYRYLRLELHDRPDRPARNISYRIFTGIYTFVLNPNYTRGVFIRLKNGKRRDHYIMRKILHLLAVAILMNPAATGETMFGKLAGKGDNFTDQSSKIRESDMDPRPYVHCVRPQPERKTTADTKKKKKKKKTNKTSKVEVQGVSSETLQESKILETVKNFGYSSIDVQLAAERVKESGEEITFDSIIDVVCEIQNEDITKAVRNRLDSSAAAAGEDGLWSGTSDDHACGTTLPDVPTTSHSADLLQGWREVEEEASGSDSEEQQRLDYETLKKEAIEKRKLELQAAIESLKYTCKMCNSSPASILLLPCGHLASCDSCLMDVRRCPVSSCNKIVRGTKEVYFV